VINHVGAPHGAKLTAKFWLSHESKGSRCKGLGLLGKEEMDVIA
jgi:hypothetical protein